MCIWLTPNLQTMLLLSADALTINVMSRAYHLIKLLEEEGPQTGGWSEGVVREGDLI